MEFGNTSNVIKPKLFKKYVMALSFITVLNLIQIFGPVVMNNDFNPIVIISQLIAITLMLLAFTNYFYKIINLEEGKLLYKGLTFTTILNCKDVEKVVFERKLSGKRTVYNLTFEGTSTFVLKDAQNYNKEGLKTVLFYIQNHSKVTT